jgi:hypothetical protein
MQKHVALYEEYKNPWENDVLRMEMEKYDVDLSNFPKQIEAKSVNVSPEDKEQMKDLGFDSMIEINDHSQGNCTLMYTISAVHSRHGIEDINFELKGVRILLEYSVWDSAEDDEIWHEIELEDGGDLAGRVEFETQSLPFYPHTVEIDMHGGFDVSKFTYKVQIGN